MSEENLALLREGVEAYNRGDLSFVYSRAAEDIEIYADPGLANSGTYHGRDAFERWTQEWLEAWSDFSLDVRAVEEIDERFLVVEVLQRGVGAESGIEVEMKLVQLIEVREGEIARFHLYPGREPAEAALDRLRAEPPRITGA